MSNVANSISLTTDLSVAPYYDDYDKTKQFYRILYRPGNYAVQARELTQMQTMIQAQISRFGQHIFTDGSIVLPGSFDLQLKVDYVKVKDTDNGSNEVNIDDWLGVTVTGQTTGISATIVAVEDGTETETNKKTIYVTYLSSASDGTTKVFADSEVLLDSEGNSLVAISSSATGFGSRFSISEGVVFAKEHFIWFPSQSITLERYSSVPNNKVGFIVTESLVRYNTDESLLDPAVGASNYTAPGADRLKLSPTLEKYNIGANTSADFIKLFDIEDGVIQSKNERTQYSIIMDELAKRTYDESGDYYVNGMDVRLREHYDNGVNFGYSNTGNSQLLAVGIEPGVAYVKGYEVNNLVTKWLTTDKGLDYSNVNSQIISSTHGSFVAINEVVGAWTLDEGLEIGLYDTAQNRLSESKWSTTAQSGDQIGTAKIKSIEYASGTPGTPAAVYNLYLMDIRMTGSNTFSNVKSVYYNNASIADIGADVVLSVSNTATLQETSSNPLLYYVGTKGVRTIRDATSNPDTTFIFKRTEDVSIASDGTFSVSIIIGSETTPYGTSTLSDAQKAELMLTINENKSVSVGAGTVSATNGSTTLVGSGTTFTNLNVGDKIEFSGVGGTYYVATIANTTHLTTTSALPDITANTVTRAFKTGDIIDLTGKGTSGSDIAVTSTSSSLSFDLKTTFGSSVSGTLTYKVARSSAREIAKTLRNSRYVIINTATHDNGSTGPYSLGFSDIYQIRQVRRKTGSTFSTATEGTDVTAYFTTNNGQKDAFYDHGYIKPKSGFAIGGTDYLLVELDYFEPDFTQGVGYFSIDSYPIDDGTTSNTTIHTENVPIYKSVSTDISYNLRNYLDFRPVKDATAADATTVGSASTNPTSVADFVYETNGLRIPAHAEQVTFDYSYYLARRDIVVVNNQGKYTVIKGVPGTTPRTPYGYENTMTLASLYIPPYPSLSPKYAQVLSRTDIGSKVSKVSNKRFTMRDIGLLKQRLDNVETYVSLNLLEKNTLDLAVLDENGLDRFKNGIFVDPFKNHNLGASWLPDYKIAVDPDATTIRPIFEYNSIQYKYVANTNTVINNNVVMLPYTEETLFDLTNVTTYRNTEFNTYKFAGRMHLSPESDFWVDTVFPPDDTPVPPTDGDPLPNPDPIPIWDDWSKRITGTDSITYLNTFSGPGSILGALFPPNGGGMW